MTDFFGYSREIMPNGSIMSSEFATLSLGSGRMALVQTVSANYTQQVNAKFELGSATLYWVTGQPQGDVTFRRLVGKSGFLADFGSMKGACGTVIGVSIGGGGNVGCPGGGAGGSGLQFSGGVPLNISVDITAGSMEVSEGGAIRVANMNQG